MMQRSVLYAVYELLPVEMVSRFFILTSQPWYEYYTNTQNGAIEQKKIADAYRAKALAILNSLLAKLWEPVR